MSYIMIKYDIMNKNYVFLKKKMCYTNSITHLPFIPSFLLPSFLLTNFVNIKKVIFPMKDVPCYFKKLITLSNHVKVTVFHDLALYLKTSVVSSVSIYGHKD